MEVLLICLFYFFCMFVPVFKRQDIDNTLLNLLL